MITMRDIEALRRLEAATSHAPWGGVAPAQSREPYVIDLAALAAGDDEGDVEPGSAAADRRFLRRLRAMAGELLDLAARGLRAQLRAERNLRVVSDAAAPDDGCDADLLARLRLHWDDFSLRDENRSYAAYEEVFAHFLDGRRPRDARMTLTLTTAAKLMAVFLADEPGGRAGDAARRLGAAVQFFDEQLRVEVANQMEARERA